MKTSLRVYLTVAVFLGVYLLCFFVLLIALPDTLFWLGTPLSLVAAAIIARKSWLQLADGMPESPLAWAAYGAAAVGVAGFIVGFIGPMIFAPGANQGPLLGILITGPLGVLVGAIGGFIVGMRKRAAS